MTRPAPQEHDEAPPIAVSVARIGTYPAGWGGAITQREKSESYRDTEEHLRDELWRLWLRVEYEIRRRWERGAVPRGNDETGLGSWGTGDMTALFRFAHAELGGEPLDTVDHGSRAVLDAYLRYSTALERRVEATLAAGRRLPLMEVVRCFGLDSRQRGALTCALLLEVDPHLLHAYRYLSHDPSCRGLDGRLLALLVYDSPASRSRLAHDLSASSPLISYGLLEQDDSSQRHEPILYRRLRPAARLVSILGGDPLNLDPLLSHLASAPTALASGRFARELVDQAAQALASHDAMLVVQGQRGVGKRLLIQTAAAQLQQRVIFIDGRQFLPMRQPEMMAMLRGLLRELRLLDAIPVVADLDDVLCAAGEQEQLPAFLHALAAGHQGPLAVTICRERVPRLNLRPTLHLALGVPSFSARVELWVDQLPDLPRADAETLAQRFAVTGGVISMAARAALAARSASSGPPEVGLLTSVVRGQLHDQIQRLGRRLETNHTFDDLVVDDDIYDMLLEILSCVADRAKVREEWGFRGAQGVSVLLTGEPGVGKTMSATVLARALGLAIYEIDLSQVMSKWVGETEKNLAEVFDAAEPGHIVLLFNEADSLFGKRTVDVKTANDRYANLETNYLLQRLERFNGLAILTTNLGKAIDPAFRRRFAYDVNFPFPCAPLRTELWRRAIPPQARTADVDFDELGRRFELSGGFIKVAAERSAFVAASRQEALRMDIIAMTVERMYRERGKLAPIGKLE